MVKLTALRLKRSGGPQIGFRKCRREPTFNPPLRLGYEKEREEQASAALVRKSLLPVQPELEFR